MRKRSEVRAAAAPAQQEEQRGSVLAFEQRLDAMRPREPRTSRRRCMIALNNAEADLLELQRAGWRDARPMHFVALYACMHRAVYKVDAEDLLQNGALFSAANAAKRMLQTDFGGDPRKLVDYMSWCWSREKRCTDRSSGWRVTWRMQFVTRNLVIAYRIAINGR